MRRAVAGFWWSPTAGDVSALVVTAVFFALGGLAGCLIALGTEEAGSEALRAYLDQFLSVAQAGCLAQPAEMDLLWRDLRWPLAAFLLGFTALGLIALPALASLRGFFLAFSIASFVKAYGRRGSMVAFLLLGLPGALYVPAFFLLTTQSLAAACSLAGRTAGQGRRTLPYHREYFFRCGLCAVAVFIGILLERYLVPILLAGLAGSIVR